MEECMFSSTEQIQPTDPPKNAILAAILSLLHLGGVGQIYLGQMKKGIIIIVATIVLACVGIGFIIPFVGAVDAYILADKLQKGEAIGDMQWFWES
jgi:TM2 domain-containing membrane protein YozV